MFIKSVNVLIVCVFIIISWSSVFAQENIDFTIDKNQVSTWESFILTINLETTSTWVLEIQQIKWLDEFVNLWKSSSNQISIINWVSTNKYTLNLSMWSTKQWDYIIWPVEIKIWENIIESNIINLKVVEWSNQWLTNKVWNLTPINSWNNSNNWIVQQKNDTSIKAKSDIKNIKSWNNIFYEFMFYQVLIIILLVWLYYYNTKIAQKNRLVKEKEENDILIYDSKKNDLVDRIKKMFKSVEVLSKTDFYQKLNKVFREYFELLWFENTDMMTLKEIKELQIEQELIELFERSYYFEFSNQKETYKSREDLINDLLRIITK